MTTDTLAEDVAGALRDADAFLRNNQTDQRAQHFHLGKLETLEARLKSDIEERSTARLEELGSAEAREIDTNWKELTSPNNSKYIDDTTIEEAHQRTFEQYRLINGGALPRNISPVLYWIPLLGVTVAEWYVNYSTFAATFVPLVAIFGTLIVGGIFSVASHLHGAYLKQLPEMLHPSTEYRNVLGQKIAVAIATFCLLVALGTVIYLRYSAIAGQLGIGTATSGTFGQPSGSLVWSRLGPTLVFNIGIWALGTLYSWTMHERVPELRESYRKLLGAKRKLAKANAPYIAAEKRIRAKYKRERDSNQLAIHEHQNSLSHIEDMIRRIKDTAPGKIKEKRAEAS